MDGIILDLNKDLTNEQIDAIVKKLQSKKKVIETPIAVLTKQEKSILAKITKHVVSHYGGHEEAYSVKHFDAEDYRKFVVEHIQEDIDNIDSDLEGELECCEESIEDSLDRIAEEKQNIIGYEKEAIIWKKKIEKHKEAYKLFQQLKKEFYKNK